MIKDKTISRKKLDFEISYVSELGGRPVNEDVLSIDCTNDVIWLSVADGLGAHGGGDIAAAVASDTARDEYKKIARPNPKKMFDIFETANSAVIDKQTEEIQMKTTFACVLCRGRWMYTAHLGDTRIYIFKDSRQVHLSKDHSVAYEEMIRDHGTLDDIRSNPKRHILKAALGAPKIKFPDFFRQRLSENLSVLICSDGFWEYVNEDDMLDTLNSTKSAHDWLDAMLKRHSEKIDTYADNYTAICLRIIKK